MDNDPSLNGKYLGTITADFAKLSEQLKEASYAIRKKGFSDYPIFPICKEQQPIGQMFIGIGEQQNEWNFYITYLDEFVQIEVIDKEEDFKKAYKNPDEFCCLFVIDKEFTNFIFVPYPED